MPPRYGRNAMRCALLEPGAAATASLSPAAFDVIMARRLRHLGFPSLGLGCDVYYSRQQAMRPRLPNIQDTQRHCFPW